MCVCVYMWRTVSQSQLYFQKKIVHVRIFRLFDYTDVVSKENSKNISTMYEVKKKKSKYKKNKDRELKIHKKRDSHMFFRYVYEYTQSTLNFFFFQK